MKTNDHLTAPHTKAVGGGEDVQPQHEHDCDNCIFLGIYSCPTGRYAGTFDLYYHPKHTEHGVGEETLIARNGDGGSYYSGMTFAQPCVDVEGGLRPGIAPLVEAKRIAVALGLIEDAA